MSREPRSNGWEIRRYPDGRLGGVAFDCPGCGSDSYVPINDGEYGNGWDFTGTDDSPTLRPSLGQRCCGWHGYLTDGKLVPV